MTPSYTRTPRLHPISLPALLLAIACSAADGGDASSGSHKGNTGGSGSSTGGGATTGSGGSSGSGSTGSGAGPSIGGVCTPGATQTCFPFDPALDGIGRCERGNQSCALSGEFGSWGPCEGATGPEPEVCGDGIDDDCDGGDLPCGSAGSGGTGASGGAGGVGGSGGGDEICQSINIVGDCVTVQCPPSAPHPKSCQVFFSPGDDRGCVANAPGSSVVYLQAGDQCNAGFITGSLCCTATPQPPLDQQSCPINKPVQYHVANKSECPAITD